MSKDCISDIIASQHFGNSANGGGIEVVPVSGATVTLPNIQGGKAYICSDAVERLEIQNVGSSEELSRVRFTGVNNFSKIRITGIDTNFEIPVTWNQSTNSWRAYPSNSIIRQEIRCYGGTEIVINDDNIGTGDDYIFGIRTKLDGGYIEIAMDGSVSFVNVNNIVDFGNYEEDPEAIIWQQAENGQKTLNGTDVAVWSYYIENVENIYGTIFNTKEITPVRAAFPVIVSGAKLVNSSAMQTFESGKEYYMEITGGGVEVKTLN